MKKYIKELIAILVVILLVYLSPIIIKNPFALISGQAVMVFIISLVAGIILDSRFKFILPIVIGLSFLSVVFLHYNLSALIYALIYTAISYAGVVIGSKLK